MCDSVQNYSGKLVVVGAMNSISVPAVPVMISNLSVAIRMVFEYGEDMPSTYQVSITKPQGGILVETTAITPDVKQPAEGDFSTVDFNFGLNNVRLDEFGTYIIKMTADDQVYDTKFLVKSLKK